MRKKIFNKLRSSQFLNEADRQITLHEKALEFLAGKKDRDSLRQAAEIGEKLAQLKEHGVVVGEV